MEYFKNLYNVDSRGVTVNTCGYVDVGRGNYLEGASVKKQDISLSENGKAAVNDEVTGEIIKICQ